MGEDYGQRKIVEILKILEASGGKPVGARVIAAELRRRGYELNERTVRYHLRILDERGMTKNLAYDGRVITPLGLEEIKRALLGERLGFIITKIESLIFRMDFDPLKASGRVIVNFGLIAEKHLPRALEIMRRVVEAGYCVSPLIKILRSGEGYGGFAVPADKALVATVCSITLDGILHKGGIPVQPKFGGVIQIVDNKPVRFSEAITYSGSTLDPHDILAVKGLTQILKTINSGTGQVLANYREIPMEALPRAREVLEEVAELGIKGVLAVGEPNKPVLGVTPSLDRAGLAFLGGTNPLAALVEAGIGVQVKAIEGLMEIGEMAPVDAYLTVRAASP